MSKHKLDKIRVLVQQAVDCNLNSVGYILPVDRVVMVFIMSCRRGGLRLSSSYWRLFSSNKNYALNYLDNWVGTTKRPPAGGSGSNTNTPHTSAVNTTKSVPPSASLLHVTATSYLLPTLRLPRDATSAAVSGELASFLSSNKTSSNNNINNHAIKSMLEPKQPPGTNTWKVPIILDLSAFQHDGSPHYRPPSQGFLNSIVAEFDKLGISIVGLTNVQNIDNVGDEISDLGIPVLKRVGSGRTLGKSRGMNEETNNAVGVEDIVQLIRKRNIEDHHVHMEDDVGESTHEEDQDTILPREDITDHLSYRELQKKCKSLGLSAVGNTLALQERLMDYFGYSYMIDEQSQKIIDDGDDGKMEAIESAQHDGVEDNVERMGTSSSKDNLLDSFPFQSSLVPPKIYNGIVRSGQQVSTDKPNQSLIILGNVSSGGEVMADGDIYVFGALRGRAVAGLAQPRNDNETGEGEHEHGCRILCSIFDAELVCIGDTFTTVDSVKNLGLKEGSGACVTSGEDGLLKFTPF